jgi:hypothetical protein
VEGLQALNVQESVCVTRPVAVIRGKVERIAVGFVLGRLRSRTNNFTTLEGNTDGIFHRYSNKRSIDSRHKWIVLNRNLTGCA